MTTIRCALTSGLRGARACGLAAFLALVLAAALPSGARAEYPERQITLVVCFAPGGGTDIAARLISTPLSQALGKSVVVENKAGAGGNIGISAVARAVGDGYTLLACSSAFVVNPSLYAQVSYDPFKDFVPLVTLGASPNVFTVPAASPVKTLPEFIEKARTSREGLNWTSPGAGTTPYLAGEVLKLRTGIRMQHIPFTGAGPAVQAALAGQVDMMTANLGSVAPLIEGGKLRAVAVTADKRWGDLPDVPTLEELGIKDAESNTFQGIYAPAGTPKPVVDRLAKEIIEIIRQPEMREKFRKSGLPVLAEGPDEFRARIEREYKKYKQIVDAAGLQIGAGR